MGHNKTMVFALAGTFLVFLAVALFLIFSYRSEHTEEVLLPAPAVTGDANYPSDPGNSDNSGITSLQVTVENAQAVISTLKRPESFSEDIVIETAWSGGKSKFEVSTWSRKGTVRTSIKPSESKYKKEVILTQDMLYVWYDGESHYYSGKPGNETAADDYQMIPTYEDVLKISKTHILEAGFAQKNDEPCIFVRAHGELGYTDIYYISVATGLLYAAESYDGETLIYSMTAANVSLGPPPDDKFVLPDGKSVLS